MPAVIDLTGEKFGRLTVLAHAGKTNDRKALWLCRCECGNETTTTGKRLRKGETLSCGCLMREAQRANLKPGAQADLDRYKQLIHDAGFTPGEAKVSKEEAK